MLLSAATKSIHQLSQPLHCTHHPTSIRTLRCDATQKQSKFDCQGLFSSTIAVQIFAHCTLRTAAWSPFGMFRLQVNGSWVVPMPKITELLSTTKYGCTRSWSLTGNVVVRSLHRISVPFTLLPVTTNVDSVPSRYIGVPGSVSVPPLTRSTPPPIWEKTPLHARGKGLLGSWGL